MICASHLNGKMLTPNGERKALKDDLRTLETAGTYELQVRGSQTQPARTAQIEVRYGALSMPVPAHKNAFVRAVNPQPIPMSVVWVREIKLGGILGRKSDGEPGWITDG